MYISICMHIHKYVRVHTQILQCIYKYEYMSICIYMYTYKYGCK